MPRTRPKRIMTHADWQAYQRRVTLRRADRWQVLLDGHLTHLTVTREPSPLGFAWHIASPPPERVTATTHDGLTTARRLAASILAGSPDIVSISLSTVSCRDCQRWFDGDEYMACPHCGGHNTTLEKEPFNP